MSASAARAQHLKQSLGSATSSVTPTGLSEAPTTFRRFPELPNELQMEIWSWAIPGIDLHLGDPNLTSLLDDQSIIYSRFQPSDKASHTFQMTLLATCRMPRLIVLETWRMVIAGVPDEDDMYSWKISPCIGWIVETPNRAHRRTLYAETENNVLRIADGKIEE